MLTEEQIEDFFNIPVSQASDRNAKLLFSDPENVRGLLQIVANELVDNIDFSHITPIKQSHLAESLRVVESDIVLQVPFEIDGKTDDLLIYILIEHQSTVDRIMSQRVLYYMGQIHDAERRILERSDIPRSKWKLSPILPIVFFTGGQQWERPVPLSDLIDAPETLDRFIPKFDILFLNVKEISETDLWNMDHPFGWLLSVLQKERADTETLHRTMLTALSRLDTHAPEHPAQHRLALLFLAHFVLYRRPENERENLMQLIQQHTDDTEAKNIMKSAAETLIEQGEHKGYARGKVEGKAEGIEQGKTEGIEQGKTEGIEQGKAEGIEQGKDEIYRAWYADWESRRQAAAEKGIPFDDPPPPNPNNHINQQ